MTILVGVEFPGGCVIGADTQATSGWMKHTVEGGKIVRKDPFVLAVTGTPRLVNFLQHSWTPPKREVGETTDHFLFATFIDDVRKSIKDAGIGYTNNGLEQIGKDDHESHVLVAFGGKVYTLYADYQIHRNADGYNAMGAGREFAMGAMATAKRFVHADDMDGAAVVAAIGLEAAAKFSAACGEPFTYDTQFEDR